MLGAGHIHAQNYPIGMVWVEADFVIARDNARMANEATLLQLAVASMLSRKAKTAFDKQVKALTDGD